MKFTTTLFALTAIVPTVLGGGFAATCNVRLADSVRFI